MLFGAAGIIAMVVALTASGGSSPVPKSAVRPVRPAPASPSVSPLGAASAAPLPTDAPVDTPPPTADPALTAPVVIAPPGKHRGHHED